MESGRSVDERLLKLWCHLRLRRGRRILYAAAGLRGCRRAVAAIVTTRGIIASSPPPLRAAPLLLVSYPPYLPACSALVEFCFRCSLGGVARKNDPGTSVG